MAEPFLAEIKIFGGNFAPRGYAFCDGQLMLISQNTALFSLVGATYGGDGRSTMGMPDLRGRAPMHPGRGPGLSIRQLAEKEGSEGVTLNETQIPAHTHELRGVTADTNTSASPVGAAIAQTSTGGTPFASVSNEATTAMESLASEGGSQSHNNMQPFQVLNFIIALTGIFPSRS